MFLQNLVVVAVNRALAAVVNLVLAADSVQDLLVAQAARVHLANLLQVVILLVPRAGKDLNPEVSQVEALLIAQIQVHHLQAQAMVLQKDLVVAPILQLIKIKIMILQHLQTQMIIIVVIILKPIIQVLEGVHFGHTSVEVADIFTDRFILVQLQVH
ncbi:MAG: hypothetical protein A370_02859 [Clostridium sp. Maddingley MBC34-26]|nr:MAG: hypothetical protein A370_02859 [Clostridium sp. Maddingley MBC34-26]